MDVQGGEGSDRYWGCSPLDLDFPTEAEGVDDCDIERCWLEALHTFWDQIRVLKVEAPPSVKLL